MNEHLSHISIRIRIVLLSIFFTLIGILLFTDIKTPENFRFMNDVVQSGCVLTIMWLVILPSKKVVRASFYLGLSMMIWDFILETIAVKMGWWYPLGGIQLAPYLVIPLEMVISFLFLGMATGFLFGAPIDIRQNDNIHIPHQWLKRLVQNPRFDLLYQLGFIVILAFVGMDGDYNAGPSIWVPGPSWQREYTFLIWLFGGLLGLFLFKKFTRLKIADFEK